MTGVIAPIDPLARVERGRYEDHRVVVERGTRPGVAVAELDDGRLAVRHRLDDLPLDDDLAEVLEGALAVHTQEHDVFARAFTGLVLTSAADPEDAWERFYRNSLDRLLDQGHDGYVQVYRHALDLLPRTSVLDLGCGFGFLALHLARAGVAVSAADCDRGAVSLLTRVATRLRRPVTVVTTDGSHVPLPAGGADAVALLHVLEHVDARTGRDLLAEAMRIARSRVVVAVPFEERPTALYGHVRRITSADLHELGTASGWKHTVHEYRGGWLVLDRAASLPSGAQPG